MNTWRLGMKAFFPHICFAIFYGLVLLPDAWAQEEKKPESIKLKDGMAKVETALKTDDDKDKVQKQQCKIFAIKLMKGKSYQIDMQSKEVDSFLRLENAVGKELAKDDDSGEGRDARVQFNCPEDGEYRIIATTFFGGMGGFTLTVKEK